MCVASFISRSCHFKFDTIETKRKVNTTDIMD